MTIRYDRIPNERRTRMYACATAAVSAERIVRHAAGAESIERTRAQARRLAFDRFEIALETRASEK